MAKDIETNIINTHTNYENYSKVIDEALARITKAPSGDRNTHFIIASSNSKINKQFPTETTRNKVKRRRKKLTQLEKDFVRQLEYNLVLGDGKTPYSPLIWYTQDGKH